MLKSALKRDANHAPVRAGAATSFRRIEDAEVGYESTAARVRAHSGRPVLLLLSPDDTTSGEKSTADTFAHAAAS